MADPAARTQTRSSGRSQPPIADYGFISDCQSAALIDRAGSIDWWCVPRFDSPSVFGRLLDPDAGHCSVRPVGDFDVDREYLSDSLVLRTTFRTADGVVTLTDAGAFQRGSRGHDIGHESPHVILRGIEAVAGCVEMAIEFAPRMEYGRTEPHLTLIDGGVRARGGPARLTLTCPAVFRIENGVARARIPLDAGERIEMSIAYEPSYGISPLAPDRLRHRWRTRSPAGNPGLNCISPIGDHTPRSSDGAH